MRKGLNKHFLLPISDLVRGRSLNKTIKRLDSNDELDYDELKMIQLMILNRILKESTNINYYNKIIEKHIKGDTLQDLSELSQLPVLTKDIIRDNYPDNIALNPLPNKGWRYHKTGGSTTGEPLVTIEDDEASDYGRAAFYRAWKLMGWEIGAPAIKIWGRPMGKLGIKKRSVKTLSEWFMNMPSFNAFQMDEELFVEIINFIKKKEIQFIYGYASAIDELAKYINQNQIELKTIKGIMSTAEVLYPNMKERIQKAFEAPVYNGYACGEVNGVAYQRDPSSSDLEITMERTIVEIVDEQGNPLPNGTPGKIALTDLHKKIMPLIRYVPGDEGVIVMKKNLKGKLRPHLSKILGRTCDVIDGINGKQVHSYFFARFFSNLNWEDYGLKRFQVIQNDLKSLDIYIDIANIPPKNEIERLKFELSHYVGQMNFQIHWNEGIEISKSGKLRWTINKLRT